MNRSCQATMPLVVLAIVLSGSINLAQDSLQETLSALSPTPEIKPPQQQPTLKIDADEVPDITGPWKIRLPDLEAPTLAHIRRVRGKQPDEVYALKPAAAALPPPMIVFGSGVLLTDPDENPEAGEDGVVEGGAVFGMRPGCG